MPVSERDGPWDCMGVLQRKAPEPDTTLLVTSILPKDLPPTSEVSLGLLCVMHFTLVQNCDLQVWELNAPCNFLLNLSPVHMGTRWADLIII